MSCIDNPHRGKGDIHDRKSERNRDWVSHSIATHGKTIAYYVCVHDEITTEQLCGLHDRLCGRLGRHSVRGLGCERTHHPAHSALGVRRLVDRVVVSNDRKVRLSTSEEVAFGGARHAALSP